MHKKAQIFFKDYYAQMLFLSITLCFVKTYTTGLILTLIVSCFQFYRLYKGKITDSYFFETYFYLFIYSSVFSGSINKIIAGILLIFFLGLRILKKTTVYNSKKKYEKLFFFMFGILLINHIIFPPYLKGLDIFIYFLLIPLLFTGIKVYNFKISIKTSLKTFISSVLIASVLLIIINLLKGELKLTTGYTFFPEPIDLSHVYFGIFLGLANCFLLILHTKKEKFINIPVDSTIFIFNCFLAAYTGARMSLLSILFVLLVFIYNKVSYKTSVKIILVSSFLIVFSFFCTKIPRIQQGIREIKELRKSIEVNNKEDIMAKSWKNIHMRYLVTKYTFNEIKDNWMLGTGMQNVRKQISEKIAHDGYKNFRGINPHNQYLHFFAGMGILGLLYFICILLYMLKQKTISIYFMLFFLLVMLTESILVRGKGILLFTFFSLLFLNKNLINDKNCSHS